MSKKNKSITDIFVEGMKVAQRRAIEKAIATNTPLIVWRNNKIVEIPPRSLKRRAKELGWR